MRKLLAVSVAFVAVAVVVIPALVAFFVVGYQVTEKRRLADDDIMICVYRQDLDKVEEMPLEFYIKGVLSAEMPANFELEALKAQAVAARTYAAQNMRRYGGKGAPDHLEADVSTDFATSQAWISEEKLKERWQEKYAVYWQKISEAVESTRGEVALYDGEPIRAVFHSTSGERTASAKEVWGNDFPYLQTVVCHWDQDSPRYEEERRFALSELGTITGTDTVAAVAQGGSFAKVLSYTESGRVKEAKIGEKTLSGQEARKLLGLRSDAFSIRREGDVFVFDTFGYGHGVGLCQYGANGMAKIGRDYREILRHYYTGIEIGSLQSVKPVGQ